MYWLAGAALLDQAGIGGRRAEPRIFRELGGQLFRRLPVDGAADAVRLDAAARRIFHEAGSGRFRGIHPVVGLEIVGRSQRQPGASEIRTSGVISVKASMAKSATRPS